MNFNASNYVPCLLNVIFNLKWNICTLMKNMIRTVVSFVVGYIYLLSGNLILSFAVCGERDYTLFTFLLIETFNVSFS